MDLKDTNEFCFVYPLVVPILITLNNVNFKLQHQIHCRCFRDGHWKLSVHLLYLPWGLLLDTVLPEKNPRLKTKALLEKSKLF